MTLEALAMILKAAGYPLVGADLTGSGVRLLLATPTGVNLPVDLPPLRPRDGEAQVTAIEAKIRMALRPYTVWADMGTGW